MSSNPDLYTDGHEVAWPDNERARMVAEWADNHPVILADRRARTLAKLRKFYGPNWKGFRPQSRWQRFKAWLRKVFGR